MHCTPINTNVEMSWEEVNVTIEIPRTFSNPTGREETTNLQNAVHVLKPKSDVLPLPLILSTKEVTSKFQYSVIS